MDNTKFISLSSIRGGSGKTTIALGLSINLTKSGKKVLLIDFDLAGPFLDIIFNYKPIYTLTHYITRKNLDIDSKILTKKEFTLKHIIKNFKINNINLDVIFADRELYNMKTCLKILETNEGLEFVSNIFNDLKENYNYDYIIIDNGPGILDTNLISNFISNFVFFILRKRNSEIKDLGYWINIFKNAFSQSDQLIEWGIIFNQKVNNKVLIKNDEIKDKIILEIPFYQDFGKITDNEFKYLMNNEEHPFFKDLNLILDFMKKETEIIDKNLFCVNCGSKLRFFNKNRKDYQYFCKKCNAWVKSKGS